MTPEALARWEALAREPTPWPGRLAALARHIPPGSSVLDIGAGSRDLALLLPPECRYQALDCVAGPTPGGLVVDLETCEGFPAGLTLCGYDVAVMAGVLEHLVDPIAALSMVFSWAHRVLFTYEPAAGSGVYAGGHKRLQEPQLFEQAEEEVLRRPTLVGFWCSHGIYLL